MLVSWVRGFFLLFRLREYIPSMITLRINGQNYHVEAESDELLVWVIHEKAGLTKTRFGCGVEMCGACKIMVDGEIIRSCVTDVGEVVGKDIFTREGVGDDHPLNTGKDS